MYTRLDSNKSRTQEKRVVMRAEARKKIIIKGGKRKKKVRFFPERTGKASPKREKITKREVASQS